MSKTIESDSTTADKHASNITFKKKAPALEPVSGDTTKVESDVVTNATALNDLFNKMLDQLNRDAKALRSIANAVEGADKKQASTFH